jgi:hypothetical protein
MRKPFATLLTYQFGGKRMGPNDRFWPLPACGDGLLPNICSYSILLIKTVVILAMGFGSKEGFVPGSRQNSNQRPSHQAPELDVM